MVNNNASAATTRAAISNGEMLSILNLAGLQSARTSPLAQISGQPGPLNTQNLQAAGLTDGAGRPTPALREALTVLANPATEIDLVWGGPKGISLSKVYSAGDPDKLVSFTSLNGTNNISYFLSPNDVSDLLAEKLVFAEIKNIAPLNLEIPPDTLPVFFGVLDAYREAQLRAALERREEVSVAVTPDEVNRIVQEAKMETNFSWYSPVAYSVMPPGIAVTETLVEEGLKTLKNEGIIGAGGEFSESLNAFAYRAFPVAGFVGIQVFTAGAGSVEKTQLALFRGISTLLLTQLTNENGKDLVMVSSISTSQLPELLFNLSTRPFEAAAPPLPAAPANTVKCRKCGTQNDAKSKFCSKCGAPLPAPSALKFCPKCGDPVTAGEKFCDKCGAPLK